MAILITGGTGFIGSHSCLEILKRRYDIVIIDALFNSSELVLERIKILLKRENHKDFYMKFYKCDLRNEETLREIFQKQVSYGKPIKAVIHFAGSKSVGESFCDPDLYWNNNLVSSYSLFKIMEEFNCKKLVFSSSASVYSYAFGNKVYENSKLGPSSPYGETKLAIEELLRKIHLQNNGWQIISLRYFNPIGAHPSGIIGEFPLKKNRNIFPQLCRVAGSKDEKLYLFGKDWPTKDGTCVRDYIHVLDLARAHLSALELLINGNLGMMCLNVGTSIGTSLLELIDTFERVNKVHIKYIFGERRIGDVAFLVADNKLFYETFGWYPKYDISRMCKDAWRWQTMNPNGYLS